MQEGEAACRVCGQPTTSTHRICQRTPACVRAWRKVARGGKFEDLQDAKPCEVCGRVTISKYGVCVATEQCQQEYHRREMRHQHERIKTRKPRNRDSWEDRHIAGTANKSQIDRQRIAGTYDDDVLEWIQAIDKARAEKRGFLTESERFQILLTLGYRKVKT